MKTLFVALCLLGACSGARASRQDCERILDRIVDIELKERGYKDPMLQTIKRATFKRKLDRELEQCVGRKLMPNALTCVDKAETIEALTHDCLGG
ncbi:MAG: hypothetical protein IT381_16070 [Deltaproteobacteria bacterium]|nr:hypothetical protein [Deltaproteobacteria bacterium]